MPTDQIAKLNPAQRQRLNEYVDWWSKTWLSTEPNDQEAVERVLGNIYQRCGRKPPLVIWCDSPWQMAVAPFLLRVICFRPTESQRRLLRRSYDSGDLFQAMRFELASNLNEELWMRAFDTLMCQVGTEVETTFATEASDPGSRPMISIERAIGLRLENVMGQAHADMRRTMSTLIIEEVMRELTEASRAAMRARITLEQHLSFQVGRRFSDFNVSIRGGSRTPDCPLVNEFINQMGREFSTHIARLLTEDYLQLSMNSREVPALDPRIDAWLQQAPKPLNLAAGHSLTETRAESRLAQAMTDYALTWANWSQDFFRVYLFPLHVLDETVYREQVKEELEELATLRMGAFMYVFNERIVFACKNPLAVRLDDRQQLHSYTQPALEFLDGYSLYSWQGVPVPEALVNRPDLLNVSFIERQDNTELRRVLVERYGTAKFILDSGAKLVAEDEFGSLFAKQMPGDEALVMVKVRNSTAEPDGTFKDYFLRVPPTIITPREAVAWTFGLTPEEYEPSVQT